MRKLYPAIILFLMPVIVFAQVDCQYLFCNPLRPSVWSGVDTFPKALIILVDLFIQIAMPIAALSIIWTGYTFATSKGDPKKIETAHRMLTYLIVGLGIMLAAKGIGMAIENTIGTVAGPGTIIGT